MLKQNLLLAVLLQDVLLCENNSLQCASDAGVYKTVSEAKCAYHRPDGHEQHTLNEEIKGHIRKLERLTQAAEEAKEELQNHINEASSFLAGLSGQLSAGNTREGIVAETHRSKHFFAAGLQEKVSGSAVQAYTQGYGRTVSRKLPAWTDYFSFLAAVRTDAKILSIALIQRTSESPPRFVVLGDSSGRIYFFAPQGNLVAEHPTGAPVTALLAHQPRSNHSILVVGLQTGHLKLLAVHQHISTRQEASSARRELITVTEIQEKSTFAVDEAQQQSPVEHLALIPAGKHGFQYVAAHADGHILVWRQDAGTKVIKDDQQRFSAEYLEEVVGENNGSWPKCSSPDKPSTNHYLQVPEPCTTSDGRKISSIPAGSVRQSTKIEERIRLLAVAGSHILVVHSRGTAVWGLNTVGVGGPKVERRGCEGLGDQEILGATVQQTRGTLGRFFGLSSDGQLLTFGAQILTRCLVANSVTAGLPMEQPVALKALPGALLLGGMKYVALYNTSGAVSRFGPAGVVAASTGNVALASGLMGAEVEHPLLAASNSGLVVVSIGSNLVAMFQSNVHRKEKPKPPPFLAWARPVIVIVAALVAVWAIGNKTQTIPFTTRREPDVMLERSFNKRPSSASNRGHPARRRMPSVPQHGFDGPHAIHELAEQLDAAAMSKRRGVAPEDTSAWRLAEEIEETIRLQRNKTAVRKDSERGLPTDKE